MEKVRESHSGILRAKEYEPRKSNTRQQNYSLRDPVN